MAVMPVRQRRIYDLTLLRFSVKLQKRKNAYAEMVKS